MAGNSGLRWKEVHHGYSLVLAVWSGGVLMEPRGNTSSRLSMLGCPAGRRVADSFPTAVPVAKVALFVSEIALTVWTFHPPLLAVYWIHFLFELRFPVHFVFSALKCTTNTVFPIKKMNEARETVKLRMHCELFGQFGVKHIIFCDLCLLEVSMKYRTSCMRYMHRNTCLSFLLDRIKFPVAQPQ